MGSRGQIGWRDLFDAISRCAEDVRWDLKTHTRVVYANGKVYPTLPKYDQLAIGHVKSLIRNLGIDADCVKKYLPALNC